MTHVAFGDRFYRKQQPDDLKPWPCLYAFVYGFDFASLVHGFWHVLATRRNPRRERRRDMWSQAHYTLTCEVLV
jgi:hypothetical protein